MSARIYSILEYILNTGKILLSPLWNQEAKDVLEHKIVTHKISALERWYGYTNQIRSAIISEYNQNIPKVKELIEVHPKILSLVTEPIVQESKGYSGRIRYIQRWISSIDEDIELYKNEEERFRKFRVPSTEHDATDPLSVARRAKRDNVWKEYERQMNLLQNQKIPWENSLHRLQDDLALVVAMGTHARLGRESLLYTLDPGIVTLIVEHIV